MTRQCNQSVVDKNVARFISRKGLSEQVANNPEVLNIEREGDKAYHYFINFTYDTRDGEIISCSSEIPKGLVNEFHTGSIGRAWIEVEKRANQLRIRKLVGYDKALKLVRLESEEKYYVSGIASENSEPNVQETTRFAYNNILETVLHFNHLQRQKRKQGVNQ